MNSGNSREGGAREKFYCAGGGPGSSAMFLELGGFGPWRLAHGEDGGLGPAPHLVVPNPNTLLRHADLDFIDPPATGHAPKNQSFQASEADAQLFARVIYQDASHNNFDVNLLGASFGASRMARVAVLLKEAGIDVKTMLFVSPLLDASLQDFKREDLLPYALILPSYSAIAHFHDKLGPLQSMRLPDLIVEVREFALHRYLPFVRQRPADPRVFEDLVKEYARYTSLHPDFIRNKRLLVSQEDFIEVMRDQHDQPLASLDGRFPCPPFDPEKHPDPYAPFALELGQIYQAALQSYFEECLGCASTEQEYVVVKPLSNEWDYQPHTKDTFNAYDSLKSLLSRKGKEGARPQIGIVNGLYDTRQPSFAHDHIVQNLGECREQIRMLTCSGGHMAYMAPSEAKRIQAFVSNLLQYGRLKP